ncbi:zinc finger protein 687a isoform X1 [Paramormyrops kingsleyae]|uniref:Zinc finger protein 687 n=1 Tax=Paramormyrops kingsleyae TaxID=1676925 RepID=A0A3B3T6N1_9TELE|nr:zinc finger protein 687b-like isoform X2 [Paramormyrops kingsleyae]XP_023657161.1 zinc finger protein 687b-like isoform X2 [Paramormyrops kingsleyae]
MGDMKTPDFDDLLAAFDIPDIDAKEAIQSAPEETEGHHVGPAGLAGKSGGNGTGVGGSGGSLMRPGSSPDHHHHPQAHPSQGDPSVVSVIVKNRVRPENFEEADTDIDKDGVGVGTEVMGGVSGGVVMGPRMPGLVSPEPLLHNGFEAAASSMDAALNQTQGQSNGELWAPCSPKGGNESSGNGVDLGSAFGTKQSGNLFNRLKPLVAQGPGDPMGKVRKMLLLQQQQLHLQQHEIVTEGTDRSKAAGSCDAAASLVPGVSVGMPSSFFPPPIPVHPSSSAPNVGPHLSHSGLHEGMASGTRSPSQSTAQLFNGPQRRGFPHLELDDVDSEPDLGSPLVIQESPDSPACTPAKFPRCHKSPAEGFNTNSSHSNPTTSTYIKTGGIGQGPSSPLPSTGSQSWLSTLPTATSVNSKEEQKSTMHVIDERDSPESPEPETPHSGLPKDTGTGVSSRRSAVAATSVPSSSALQKAGEKVEINGSKEEEARDKKVNILDGSNPVEPDSAPGERKKDEKMDVDDGDKSSTIVVTNTAVASKGTTGTPSRPLKVRIKTVKTSTGGITRTVTRVAPKGAGCASAKAGDSKAQPGGRKDASRPRKANIASSVRQPASQQQNSKGTILPVSVLQEASTAMLVAASKVQNKMAATASEKTKVSTTAVSITKVATLPSVLPSSAATSSSKSSPGTSGISIRTMAQKTVNGGTATALTGQISKPASIVNSTGAVISRSQSSLVEAFNKILNSKNLLPSYRPDLSMPLPSEWSLPLPTNGYRCLECGDAFALERSLARHYDRRSLRIEVTCNHCAKRLAFFNKCSLLLHAREHKERGLVMQCSHLVMRPISVEQMIGQQDTTPVGMLSSPLSSPSLAPVPTALSSMASGSSKEEPAGQAAPARPRRAADSPQVLLPLPCKKGEELQYHNFKCAECRAQLGSKAELVAHFQEVKAESDTSCTLCSPPMMLPNACSAAAHQRLHKHRAPHVCPECGGVARPASFQTHLDEACLHFSRRIGYRCSSCQVVFGGLNSIKSHIQTAHCEVFHKCPSCPMAFKSGPMAQAHISTQHPTLGSTPAKMIYKCVMCDTVFTQKPLLYVHFDTHLAKQKVHVFKCPDCTKLYAQKGSMMEHIKMAHRGASVKQEVPASTSTPAPRPPPPSSTPKSKSSTKMESSDGEDWPGDREEQEGEEEADGEGQDEAPGTPEAGPPGAATSEWSCRQCQTHYAEREAYISHMKKKHGKFMKKFPCRMCERSFCSAPSLRRHVRVNHEGIRRVFYCPYCTEGKRTFSSRLILEKHVRVQHGLTPQDQDGRQSPARTRARAQLDSSSEQEGGLGQEEAASGEEEGEVGAGSGSEEPGEGASPAKRPRGPRPASEEGPFCCAPCGFSTEDRQTFLQHIPQHRTDGAALQCTQCGACFASAGSFSRHRFIAHRVRDPDPAGRTGSPTRGRSDSADIPSASSSPDSPGNPRAAEDGEDQTACRVCSRHFDKLSDLNTHFRTHGMAFIASHKTDKPA